ncbi:hypothetical protein LguiB_030207 [Lonicera macranthoides]
MGAHLAEKKTQSETFTTRGGHSSVTEPRWLVYNRTDTVGFYEIRNRNRTAYVGLPIFGFTDLVGRFGRHADITDQIENPPKLFYPQQKKSTHSSIAAISIAVSTKTDLSFIHSKTQYTHNKNTAAVQQHSTQQHRRIAVSTQQSSNTAGQQASSIGCTAAKIQQRGGSFSCRLVVQWLCGRVGETERLRDGME